MKHKIIQSLIIVAFIWILICTFAHKIFNYMPMNKRNIVHLNGFVGCICNSSETGFGNQMKESEASERKKTQTSLFFHLLFLCTMLIVASCDSRKQYDFQSSNDALEEYHNFFLSIKGNTGCNAEQMATFINGWHEVADTVSCFIKKDPSFTAHCGLSARYDEISDSIRTELLRLTSNYTLSDVAYVKLHTSVYKENQELDSLKESATKFFKYLDKSPVFDKDVREGIANYSNFLLGSKAHGIKSKKELVAFLHEEDRHFRTFLANIDECSSMGMTEITNNTADICSNIYKAASEGILPTSETLVLMSMRTDRRLILNAQVCHDVLKRGKIKSANQANAYLWMMLQPYLSMDALAIAMLTLQQIQAMIHTRNGTILFAVLFTNDIETAGERKFVQTAREFHGYWSDFGGGGYIFNSRQEAGNFAKTIIGKEKADLISPRQAILKNDDLTAAYTESKPPAMQGEQTLSDGNSSYI